jgi:hypothetical protein
MTALARSHTRTLALFAALLCLCAAPSPSASPITPPGRLAIYYGFPSSVNGSSSIAQAINVFDDYDAIILGLGLQDPGHPDHANTIAIISGLPASEEVYGYVDIGNTNNYPPATIHLLIDQWNAMGVDGIFFDEYGYDFLTSRARQNDSVSYAHGLGLKALANAWDPADAMGSEVDPTFNPAGTPTALAAGDGYLLENLTMANGVFWDHSFWALRARLARQYRASLGIRIFVVNTSDDIPGNDPSLQDKIDHGFYASLIEGFDFFQHTNPNFSASGIWSGKLELHTLPTGFGASFTTPLTEFNGRLERQTDAGLIEVHGTDGAPGTNGSSFTPGGSLSAPESGRPITIDGAFGDWAGLTRQLTDGDDTGLGPDFGDVWITNDATNLYVRFQSSDAFNLSSKLEIHLDTDRDRATGGPSGWLGIDWLVQGSNLYHWNGGGYSFVSALSAAPTTSITDFEIAIPRATVGLAGSGEAVSLRLANTNASPNDDVAPDYSGGAVSTHFLADNIVPVGLSLLGAE